MASPGNPNQSGTPFDMHKLFKPSNSPTSQNPTSNFSSSPLPSSSSYPPSAGTYSYPPQTITSFHYPQFHVPPYSQQQENHHHLASLHQQRSVSYPTPPPSQNPNAGARLMALLSAPASTLTHEIPQQQHTFPLGPIQPSSSGSSDFSMLPKVPIFPSVPNFNPAPMHMLSSKLPMGRHLIGDHVVYDIDVRLEGEVQPQLEVTPITKYVSDPGLVLGRQIAVNKTYICYGLKMGAVRVLNMNTASRSLLKGLAQVGWY